LSSNPGRIRSEMPNLLPRPRDRRTLEFEELVDRLYRIMTGRPEAEEPAAAPAGVPVQADASPIEHPLPHASVGGMAGLLEIVNHAGGRYDLPELAHILIFEVDDLLPITDAAQLLGLADVADADIQLTPDGKEWAEADILTSKSIFARCARERAPLVRSIVRALETTRDGTLNERFFLDLLRRGFSEDEAQAQMDTAIDWGRYGELFDFDADTGEISLTRAEDDAAVTAS
jgi:NitT/TauT family transport system ATP-binding protein